MSLDEYNKSFEEVVNTSIEEADARLRDIRRQCAQDFLERINSRQREWEELFSEFLSKSQAITEPPRPQLKPQPPPQLQAQLKPPASAEPTSNEAFGGTPFSTSGALSFQALASQNVAATNLSTSHETKENTASETPKKPEVQQKPTPEVISHHHQTKEQEDPHFSNASSVKESERLQKMLDYNREILKEFITAPHLKEFKDDLYKFIKMQIFRISNNDPEHLRNIIQTLSNLFAGRRINFQDKVIDSVQHPQGRLYSFETTSRIFVKEGMVSPTFAKSLATVVKGIVDNNNNGILAELITAHLQKDCPYLVPRYPKFDEELKSNDKFQTQMTNMAKFYGNLLVKLHIDRAWTWLANFLNLPPEPVISALILRAFLQEITEDLSRVYGRQFRKLISFIKSDYIKLLEEQTKAGQRLTLEKLKIMLAEVRVY